jgi:hypothetical protein
VEVLASSDRNPIQPNSSVWNLASQGAPGGSSTRPAPFLFGFARNGVQPLLRLLALAAVNDSNSRTEVAQIVVGQIA